MPRADRVRMHRLGLIHRGAVAGRALLHGRRRILRSKSLDRNSYDSGDWFNRIDWTLKSNNWGVGLPPARATRMTGPSWTGAGRSQPEARRPGHRGTFQHLLEMLAIRKTSRLFRLRTAEEIKKAVSFYNVGPDRSRD